MNYDNQTENSFSLRDDKREITLYIFEEKYSLKNTLLNVLPYEQAS